MTDKLNILDFLDPISLAELSDDVLYRDGQIGKIIDAYDEFLPDFSEADIIFIGCDESRGGNIATKSSGAPNAIRAAFYQMFSWHSDIKLADAGNIRAGAVLADTYAALRTVIEELTGLGKTVVVLGGSHDLTLAQYHMHISKKQVIEATCVDALIDLNIESVNRSDNFLMEMLTGEPNFVRHYNHIAFQSYYVHPRMLETMDKLRFDCFRVGHVKDSIEEMELVIRNSNLFSFDISAIADPYAPANRCSPNGLTGEESCTLMRYAGLSQTVSSLGIYGYEPQKDRDNMTALQISHMIWYFIDGKSRGRREPDLGQHESFTEYHTAFAEVETTFIQSKRTNRWWMQLPDKKYIACSYKDYLPASSNEIPERWLRAQERG